MTTSTAAATVPFVIRDPVHGYLVVAVHERIIVDHPITQRLRRITQTGLAEYVFPDARTSRFVHSLGAMHLASRFVVAALENAEEDVAREFFADIDGRISKLDKSRDATELLKQYGTLSALAAVRASFRSSFLHESDIRSLLAIVEAGLRLAALFHDLGHLPFSHDLEYALKDFASHRSAESKPLSSDLLTIAGHEAPHEQIGHTLAELVLSSLADSTSPAVKASFDFAVTILNAPVPRPNLQKRPHATSVQWLHSLIDGEIDADRADYLLRDGQALGLDFAHYDVDRLVSNLVLIRDPDLGFTTAVREKGLAALESYCLSRSRSHQVFVRHHKVAQVAAALRHCSVRAFDDPGARPLIDVLTELGGKHANGEDLLLRVGKFDDGWWSGVLRSMQSNPLDELTGACLNLVLDRARTLKSVWKRKGDLTDTQFQKINETTDEFFVARSGAIAAAETRRRLLRKGILLNAFKFKPYARREPDKESVMLIIENNKKTVPASRISPIIRNLYSCWEEDIHAYAFVLNENAISIDEVIAEITRE